MRESSLVIGAGIAGNTTRIPFGNIRGTRIVTTSEAVALAAALALPALLSLSPIFNFILFGCFNVVGFFMVFKWLPETKGKSLEEMDELWKGRH